MNKEVEGSKGDGKVMIREENEGKGIIEGGKMSEVFEKIGVKEVVEK